MMNDHDDDLNQEVQFKKLKERQCLCLGQSTHPMVDRDLFEAVADHNNVKDFIDKLEQFQSAKGLSLFTIFDQVLSPSGNSLLHEAAKFGRTKIIKLITKHFSDLITKKNSIGDTVLHVAVKAGKIDIIKFLADSSKKCSNHPCHQEIEKLFQMKNRIGNTALHEAVIAHVHHSKEAAEYLLLVNPEAFYSLNDEGKSPFFLAVETPKINICLAKLLLQKTRNNDLVERPRGELPVYAAIFKKRRDILQLIFEERSSLLNIRDKKGKTPLHFAASTGYFEGIRFLLEIVKQSALERSKKGDFPIHTACKKGYVEIVPLLEKQWREPTELLNKEGQNILQVAAKSGRNNVVKHLLKTSQSNYWNAKDKGGNTALHLASMNLHPDVILSLTSDSRVNVKLRNGKGLTACDIAGQRVRNLPFRKLMTLWALKSAGTPESEKRMNNILSQSTKPKSKQRVKTHRPKPQGIKDYVTLLSVIAVLVATVSFAAGLTVPGGFNSSDYGPAGQGNEGMATLANKTMFQVFIISDTVAMFCSIIGAYVLLWSQMRDLVSSTLIFTHALLQIAVFAMCLAFTSAVYLVVSKISWLSIAVLIMGSIFMTVLLVIFIVWIFPFGNPHPIVRCICQVVIPLMLRFTEALDHKQELEESPPTKKDKQENSQSKNNDKQEAESQPENKDKQEAECQSASNVNPEDSPSTKHCSGSAVKCHAEGADAS